MNDAASTSQASPRAGPEISLIQSRPHLLGLPVELIDRICDFLIGRPPEMEEMPIVSSALFEEQWSRFFAGRRSICSLHLTSRPLRPIAVRFLYRDVVIADDFALFRVFRYLASMPERRPLVKKLICRLRSGRDEPDDGEPAPVDPDAASEADSDGDETPSLELVILRDVIRLPSESAPGKRSRVPSKAAKALPGPEALPWTEFVKILMVITMLARNLEFLRFQSCLPFYNFRCVDVFDFLGTMPTYYTTLKMRAEGQQQEAEIWSSHQVAELMDMVLPSFSGQDLPWLAHLRFVELEHVDELKRLQFLRLGFTALDGPAEGSAHVQSDLPRKLESMVLRFFDPLFATRMNPALTGWLSSSPTSSLKRLDYQQCWLYIENSNPPRVDIWHEFCACHERGVTENDLKFLLESNAVSSSLELLRLPSGFFGPVEGDIRRISENDSLLHSGPLGRLKYLEVNIETLFRQTCPKDESPGFDDLVTPKILAIQQYFELMQDRPLRYDPFSEDPPSIWTDAEWIDETLKRLPPGLEELVLVEWWSDYNSPRRALG
ncbi:hypothetical protein B0T22DRAFT_481339 [Podospora appendiculata]|uniref:Uncharacterized protein n=1 Tax=Podospora appendiculata TaxID=314037 RepID=A0AAE0XDA4_9PEZI|nr:hypothetical protein B0T22DRAFT_481339 [Podospora appendiculata]